MDRATPDLSGALRSNQTLAALEPTDFAVLSPYLGERHVRRGEILAGQDRPIERLYFPTTAYLANKMTFPDGRHVEVYGVGSEGVAGLAAFMADAPSAWSVEVMAAGYIFQIDAAVFRTQVDRSEKLRQTFRRVAYDHQVRAGLNVGCMALHGLPSRVARMILTIADALKAESLPFTQNDLADLLGAQRTTVNSAAGKLKQAGIIAYSRGRIHVRDRAALRAVACDCYQLQADRTASHAWTV